MYESKDTAAVLGLIFDPHRGLVCFVFRIRRHKGSLLDYVSAGRRKIAECTRVKLLASVLK